MHGAAGGEHVEQLRRQANDQVVELIERAKAAGQLREDFTGEDLLLLLIANAAVVQVTRADAPYAWRALQGIGAGGLMVGAQGIIGDIVSPRQRGRYMGYFGAVFGLSSVIGPLAGGFITQHLSWRWVFYINLPIGAVALAVIAVVLHLPRHRTRHAIDYLGTALLGAAVTTIILLTTWGGTTYAWGSATIISLAAAAVVLVALFGWAEVRAAEPIPPGCNRA